MATQLGANVILAHRRVGDGVVSGRWMACPATLALATLVAVLAGAALQRGAFFSVLWPVDALLVALMVRRGRWRNPPLWCGAATGYLIGEVIAHGVGLGAVVTAAGLAAVAVGTVILVAVPTDLRHLRRPQGAAVVVGVCLAMGIAGALIGGWAGPTAEDDGGMDGVGLWALSAVANAAILLPALLALPAGRELRSRLARPGTWRSRAPLALTATAVVVAPAIGAALVGDVGLLAPLPLLVWVALRRGVLTTATHAALWGLGTVAASVGWGGDPAGLGDQSQLLPQIGVALAALAPIALAAQRTSRADALRRLGEAVAHDPLTGVLARRAFMLGADEALARARRRQRPCAVMMLDLDHFRRLNDAHGHTGGDLILQAQVAAAAGCLRADDLVGRVGGEEFAVVLIDAPLAVASTVGERIREAMTSTAVTHEGRRITTTVSIGVAHFSQPPAAAADALMLADQALHRAKGSGRDRVVVIAPPAA